MTGVSSCVSGAFISTALLSQLTAAGAATSDQLEFFETRIRPVLAEHCYSCHSAKAEKLKGGLRLDTPQDISKGGDSGPAIVAGNPETSLLVKAVRYTDPDLRMPPKDKKLAPEQIADIEAWVKMGAPLPDNSKPSHTLSRLEEAREKHWAFHPLSKPSIPAVRLSRWVQSPIDNFILAKLEQRGLKPSAAADRRTLIRRLNYDLIGLPPSYGEVEQFAQDLRPDAYARLVERLLTSPHYGERWARYWLDVARYADTKGYLAGGEERRYAFSHTYRDYLVRAFNEDKPFDTFIIEQIAGDCSNGGGDSCSAENKQNLAALGFLTLGRRFLNNQNDIIDDRIDVVTRGFLGLTVTCARCHDHKFDPISTKDYYALHGVFASSEEPSELPLLGVEVKPSDHEDYLKAKAKIEVEISQFKDREVASFMDELRGAVGEYLLGAHEAAGIKDTAQLELFASEHKLNLNVLKRWVADLAKRDKKDPVFGAWLQLAASAGTNSTSAFALSSIAVADANPAIRKAFTASNSVSLTNAAALYASIFKDVDAQWKTAIQIASTNSKPAPTSLADAGTEALRQGLYGKDAAVNLPRAEAEEILSRKLREGAAPMRNRIEALNWTHAGAPPRAMALQDRAAPANSHVLLRGNPSTPGDEVPRRFLEVLSSGAPARFTNGSGRLELARAIASPNNPVTARVFVNRVWLHHFGEGLVRTAGDFGVRTEEPLHRDLLDYLASSFMENSWSIKALHRAIVMSAAYQQSSDAAPTLLSADADNRLLGRVNRRRLDFEAMRDTLLAVSGKLDLSLGGLPVDILAEPFSTRRTLYAYIERQNLPGLFRTFDFANPDTSNQGRFETTVPPQALFLMNSPFVQQQAKELSSRGEVRSAGTRGAEIDALYRVVLQRTPTRFELAMAERYLASQPRSSAMSPLAKFAQILLLSNEVMFID
jgi:mono/diheme cytochrome c family protein